MSAVSVNASKRTGGKETNNLVHPLNPKTFAKMFTIEKCTFEEKLIQEILKCICALRNSGGGKLTIWFTETCSTSTEAEKCVDIIKNAVNEVLSDTEKADLLEWKFSNRIVFLIKGSKEIVTMRYNMYVMTDGEAKLVPSATSAAEVRLLLHGRKEQSTTKYDMNVVTNEVAKLAPSTKPVSLPRSLLHGRKEQPTTKYDMNVVTNEVAKPVQSTKPVSLPRFLLHGRKEQPTTKYDMNVVTNEVAKPVPSTQSEESSDDDYEDYGVRSRSLFPDGTGEYLTYCTTMQQALVSHKSSPISCFVEGKRVKILTKYDSNQMMRFKLLKDTSSTEKSVAIHMPSLRALVFKSMVVESYPTHGTVYLKPAYVINNIKEYIPRNLFEIDIYAPFARALRRDYEQSSAFYSLSATASLQLPSTSFICSPEGKIKIILLDQDELVKHQQVKVQTTKLSHETVKYKRLEDDKLSNTHSVAHLITLKEHELLAYVSAFANHRQGGGLYYGISSNGTVCGEKMLETEMEKIHEKVDKEIASMVWPRHVDTIHKLWKITFLPVKDQDAYCGNLFVIKISVSPCSGGVFVENPESYHVVGNSVEKLTFSTWNACLQDSTTEVLHTAAFVEFKENEKAFDRLFLPNDYQTFLNRLEWVESFKIVDANKKCNERHLEIVFRLGKVPCTADIVNFFGEEILPFITYQECSKREWFETNIFDENSDMKYEDELASLPWVEDFYIGVASEPEKSWQIYITCAENKVPSMVDLKKLFGVNIASFVDFIQESVDEDSEDNEESLSPPSFLRGPISGDELCVQEDKGGYGAIGALIAANEKHYATTCYHVCFKEELPKKDLQKGHEILKKDCANESQGCEGATCLYTTEEERKLLGRFCHGLYDDNHDIALVELESSLNCSDMVKFLEKKGIRPVLADQKEVREMFYDKKALPVERVSPLPRKGILFGVHGMRRCPRNKRCYRIKGIGRKAFASEGDSGSLVYLVYEGENIPFAYVCMVFPESDENVYYCRNLSASTNELIKRSKRDDLKDVKPCFTDHKSENEISSNTVT